MRSTRYTLFSAAFTLGAAVACGLSLALSRHGFSSYDVSPMIDAGWRVFSGQVPGRDFVVTFPPSLYLLTALSYRLFGVTWHAIALGACCVYGAMVLLGLRVGTLVRLSRGMRVACWTAAAYAAAQTILLISINYLWHSALAESFGIYAVYATFASLRTGSSAPPRARREALVHLTLACACLLLSKPNTAYPVVLLCLLVLGRDGVRRLHLAAVLLGALLLDTLLLARVHVTLWGMLGAYSGLTGRLLPRAFFNGILYALYARYGLANLLVYAILTPVVWLALGSAWKDRRRLAGSPVDLLAIGSVLIAALGMGTNFDFKLTDTPLAIMGLAILALSGSRTTGTLRFRTLVATCALFLLAFYFGRTRFRMQIVESWADDKCLVQTAFQDRFLGRFTACAVVPLTLAEVDRTLADRPSAHVFFGPGLDFLYAARRLRSPLHLPIWWDPGSSFPLAREDAIATAWEQDNFDLLIFQPEEDRLQLPLRIQRDLDRNYVLVPGTRFLHVYQRRSPE